MRHPRRAVVDDHVDRPQVEAQRCVEPSGTNCPRACASPREIRGARPSAAVMRAGRGNPKLKKTACMCPPCLSLLRKALLGDRSGGYCAGAHLFPFRTEKLSPAAPMILHPCGKVGRRPPLTKTLTLLASGFFVCIVVLQKTQANLSFFTLIPYPFIVQLHISNHLFSLCDYQTLLYIPHHCDD